MQRSLPGPRRGGASYVSPCLHQYSFKWLTFFINYHLGLVDLKHLMSA